MGPVATGEHGAAELEQHEIEGGLEVVPEMRLDQCRADRAEIVGQPDPDTGLLARLGLRIGRRGDGGGDCGSLEPAGPGGVVAVAITGITAGAVAGIGRLRHVLGTDQPLDDLKFAVPADGGDGAGDRVVLGPIGRPGLDRRIDLACPGLDGLGLLCERLGPVVFVEIGEFVLAGAQTLKFGRLLVGRRRGLRMDAPVTRDLGPVDLLHRRCPVPAGREVLHGLAELRHGELVQERQVLEPDSVFDLGGEQIAQYRSTRALVGVDADETGHGGVRRNPLLGQQAFHLRGGRAVALVRQLRPDRHLAAVIGRDGERLQRLQADIVGAVGLEQFGRRVAEPQTLFDQALGHAETCRDGRHRDTGFGQFRERDHLVGRMHRDADDVLSER